MNYGFNHQGRSFFPDGATPVAETQAQTDARNRETEAHEIEWLKTHPEKVFLYIQLLARQRDNVSSISGAAGFARVHTWLGTTLDPNAYVGPSREFPCFGPFPSRRRSVECVIFGARYVGWYFESSGDYCRLRKAKRQ